MSNTDVLVFYASISGRTRKVSDEIKRSLSPLMVETFDLRNGLPDLCRCKLMIFGSPTYGIGDWHHLWERSSDELANSGLDWAIQPIAIFALGDAKHHAESFASAVTHLANLRQRLQALAVGNWICDESYDQPLCSSLLNNGSFPGLVLDQVNQRRLGPDRIQAWCAQLKREIDSIEWATA